MSLWGHLFPPFDAVWPNIVASLIWATPAFVLSHLVHRRHVNKRHRQILSEIHAHCDHHSQGGK